MARATRKKSLETPTARTKLAKGRWHSVNIGRGVALAYRRRGPAAGSWFARIAQEDNRYSYRRIGEADDYQDSNGITVLSYFEAQEKAREAAEAHVRELSTYTVRQALAGYDRDRARQLDQFVNESSERDDSRCGGARAEATRQS